MNIKYICRNCGGQASYNPELDTIVCDNCGSQELTYEVEERCPKCRGKIIYDEKRNNFYCENGDWYLKEEGIRGFDDDMTFHPDNLGTFESNICTCDSCGAEIIIDKNTVATKCPFCNSNINITENLIGSAQPYGIIPFKQTKQTAIESFKKWCKKGIVSPKGFMTADRIQEITPLYIPFWVYDMKGTGQIEFNGQKVRHYSDSKYNYIETKYYKCLRNINATINSLPCDASEKMDDNIMDLLEPFDFRELKPFNIEYLSGNLTEKYDYTEEELLQRACDKSNKLIVEYAKTSMSNYTSVELVRNNINLREDKAHYILLPIWTISYEYKGKTYRFIMNGQTGKVIGKPPVSKGKVFLEGLGIMGIMFIIESLIFLI